MKKCIALVVVVTSLVSLSAAESWLNRPDDPVQLFIETEQGLVSVLSHTYQIGSAADTFDFRTQGGQEILFPFERYALGAELNERHRITFTYQPLNIVTDVVFQEDVTIDTVPFTSGTPVRMSYGFPFYRITYTYDLLERPSQVLGVGAALQLRNASIKFSTQDGEQLQVSQNLGPVPALSIYSRLELPSGMILSADVTGLYASSAIINGADFEFEGSILDASLRAGYTMANGSELFGNIRFFGGSARGVSQYPDRFWSESIENFTANYLATMTVSAGMTVR